MYRIYDMQPGDVIYIDRDAATVKDIFTEANSCGKWIVVTNSSTSNEYKVEFPTLIKASHVKDQFIESGLQPTLVPDNISPTYLSRITREDPRVGGVVISAGVMKCLPPVEDHKIVKIVYDLMTSDNKTKTIPTKDIHKLGSFKSMLYNVARKLGVKIKTATSTDTLTLTLVGEYVNSNFFGEFTNWLKDIRHDEWTEIPEKFMTKGQAYLKTVISKSGLDCKYKKGQVIKLTVAIRRKNKCLDLRINGQVVKTFNTMRVCHLRRHDRALINLLIKPHGKTFEDLL